MEKGRKRSEDDDCPICHLLLPLDPKQSSSRACCMEKVCNGCILASLKRGMVDCPFCRAPTPNESQTLTMICNRVDAGDPKAIYFLGDRYDHGHYGLLEKDAMKSVKLYERAAELGVIDAHYNLGCLNRDGTVVDQDTSKAIRHFEAAAMCGNVSA